MHALSCHDRTDVGDDCVREDFVDQAVVAQVASISDLLEREAIVLIFLVLRGLNVDATVLLTLRARARNVVTVSIGSCGENSKNISDCGKTKRKTQKNKSCKVGEFYIPVFLFLADMKAKYAGEL